MNTPDARTASPSGPDREAFLFRRETGVSLFLWAAIALLHFATQILFRRLLLPGEFATLNTLLAVVALLIVPLAALHLAIACFRPFSAAPERVALRQASRGSTMKILALTWTPIAAILLFVLMDLLKIPRLSLVWLALANVLLGIGAWVAVGRRPEKNWWLFGSGFLLAAATARLAFAAGWALRHPWAETGLAAGTLAGAVTLLSLLLRTKAPDLAEGKAPSLLRDREFRLHFAATLSLALGLFLFTNGDRMVAQVWFGRSADNNMGYVHWNVFDAYQAAGLLGRGLLWGTQPLLALFLAERVGLSRTTASSLRFFWIYLGVLLLGALALHLLASPLARLFGGASPQVTAYFIPPFAMAMIPLGLLQGIGVFALASRRYPECFVLGGCSLAYVLLLYGVGRPQLMLGYVFGGGLISLMIVLFVGVVRWGRNQP